MPRGTPHQPNQYPGRVLGVDTKPMNLNPTLAGMCTCHTSGTSAPEKQICHWRVAEALTYWHKSCRPVSTISLSLPEVKGSSWEAGAAVVGLHCMLGSTHR
jgi:hypothetical protein